MVAFFPKIDKQLAQRPKSCLLMILSSFLLKPTEKVIDMYIKIRIPLCKHIYCNQFAYYAGKSTETAILSLISRIKTTSCTQHRH